MELVKPIEKLLDVQYVADELSGKNPDIDVHIGMNNRRGNLWEVFGDEICKKVLGMVPDAPPPPGMTVEKPPIAWDSLHAESEQNLRDVEAKLNERSARMGSG